jgi:diadenosine tetraphosphate (Ap4A) HIT family hydrolase
MSPSSKSPCPFCDRIEARDIVAENDLAVALVDAFPVSPGHRLIVPKRHEPDFFLSRQQKYLTKGMDKMVD